MKSDTHIVYDGIIDLSYCFDSYSGLRSVGCCQQLVGVETGDVSHAVSIVVVTVAFPSSVGLAEDSYGINIHSFKLNSSCLKNKLCQLP